MSAALGRLPNAPLAYVLAQVRFEPFLKSKSASRRCKPACGSVIPILTHGTGGLSSAAPAGGTTTSDATGQLAALGSLVQFQL